MGKRWDCPGSGRDEDDDERTWTLDGCSEEQDKDGQGIPDTNHGC